MRHGDQDDRRRDRQPHQGEPRARSTRSAQTIVKVAGHIYDVVHGIIRQLRPSALDHLGLREAVEDLVEYLARAVIRRSRASCSCGVMSTASARRSTSPSIA